MFELLHQKFQEGMAIDEEDFEFSKTLFTPKKLRKKTFLLKEGEVCRYTTFVEKGLLRSYVTDYKGMEHILQFSLEGWWVGDIASFLAESPSKYYIEALEDCELLLISKPSWYMLLDKSVGFANFFRKLVEHNLIVTQNRLIAAYSEIAEERYQNLLQRFPQLLQRVPQHMIASYLGITPETLSRVRAHLAAKD